MDIVTGLAAVSQALGIAKELREIDRGLDEAAFKLKVADLQANLADAKVALSDAKIATAQLNEKAASLEGEIDLLRNGDFCPKCRTGRMNLEKIDPYMLGGLDRLGVEHWSFRCSHDACGLEQVRIHDPHGAVAAWARKR